MLDLIWRNYISNCATFPSRVEECFRELVIDALQAQIFELEEDLKHYQPLKSGAITVPKSKSLEYLPVTLVQACIASGVSQSDLAELLGIDSPQVLHCEESEYRGTVSVTLTKTASVFNCRRLRFLTFAKQLSNLIS